MEWVPQNNWSIQGKWKWNNLLVRLVILLHAIAIKTCYKQLKINNIVHLRVLFILMKATEGSYYFDSWRIQNVGCFVDIIVLLYFVFASSKSRIPKAELQRVFFLRRGNQVHKYLRSHNPPTHVQNEEAEMTSAELSSAKRFWRDTNAGQIKHYFVIGFYSRQLKAKRIQRKDFSWCFHQWPIITALPWYSSIRWRHLKVYHNRQWLILRSGNFGSIDELYLIRRGNQEVIFL